MNAAGFISHIQRFCVHDGPGIRTSVFFKGCPLRCAWCHNPESWSQGRDLLYYPERCIGCGACQEVCPAKAHSVSGDRHVFDRAYCTRCGVCSRVCHAQALTLSGRSITADEVMDEVLRDKPFYTRGGGGLTLSGGEPMMQPAFAVALAKQARAQGISVAIETSGYCDTAHLDTIAPHADLLLFDMKLFDPGQHRMYTGASNERILHNLFHLDSLGVKLVLRCPVIPDINLSSRHFAEIAQTAARLKHLSHIDLQPYHPAGLSKYRALGMSAAYAHPHALDPAQLEPYVANLRDAFDVRI